MPHHAFLIEANANDHAAVASLLKEYALPERGIDSARFSVERLGVDEVRRIAARGSLKPVAHDVQVLIIFFGTATSEAQNALLKTLEDPAARTVYVLVTPQTALLLPTVRSRMMQYAHSAPALDARAHTFLASTTEDRLAQLKPFIEKDKETDERALTDTVAFLTGIELALAQMPRAESAEGFKALYRAKRYVCVPGASVKAILEQLAFLLPIAKS